MIFLENVIYIFFVINNILWFFSVIDVDLRVVGCMVVVMSQELGQWHFL